jgi:hypothetical protein
MKDPLMEVLVYQSDNDERLEAEQGVGARVGDRA